MSIRNVCTFIFVSCFAVSVSAEPQLSVQLDRSVIYEGESFTYYFAVSDANPVAENVSPDTSAWTDFDVQQTGRQTIKQGGSSFTMTVNGRTVRDDRTAVSYQTLFRYVLTPKRTGSLTIPLPLVTIEGNTLQPQSFSVDEGERQLLPNYAIAVRVLEPDKQDTVFLTITTNRSRLYPLQPLDVTLLIHIKSLSGRFAEVDPLSLLNQPSRLQIPWAEDDPKGFQASQRLETWLTGFLVRSPRRGFAINDYVSSGFGNFGFGADPFQRTLQQFAPPPQQVKRMDAIGNETTYWEYRFTRSLFPQEFGNYSFGPVTLKGVLPIADPSNPDEIVGQRIYAVAKPVNVAVADVPQEHRPADYIGAFGSFRWDALLTPLQAKVGDPLTLTLRLSGQGSTVNIRPIDLSANPDVTENFRIHMPPTEEIIGQTCTFIYTVRPQKSGTFFFPPISISVFDVNTEQFVSMQSLPIPLVISESESLQSTVPFSGVSHDVQLLEGGLFANKTTLSESLPMLSFTQWAVAVSLFCGSYAVIAVVVLLLRCQWTNPRQQRQRGALSRAKSRLAAISSVLRRKNSDLVEISSELLGVFFGYIADKTEGTEQGMTTSDACRQLSECRVPESLVNAVRSALESLDAVKYGGLDIRSLDEQARLAGTLLQQLERERMRWERFDTFER